MALSIPKQDCQPGLDFDLGRGAEWIESCKGMDVLVIRKVNLGEKDSDCGVGIISNPILA